MKNNIFFENIQKQNHANYRTNMASIENYNNSPFISRLLARPYAYAYDYNMYMAWFLPNANADTCLPARLMPRYGCDCGCGHNTRKCVYNVLCFVLYILVTIFYYNYNL